MAFLVLLAISPGLSAHGLAPARNVTARDEPDDGGGVIQVSWDLSESDGIARYDVVRMKGAGATEGIVVGTRNGAQDSFLDEGDKHAIEDGVDYRYLIRAVGMDGETSNGASGLHTATNARAWTIAGWVDHVVPTIRTEHQCSCKGYRWHRRMDSLCCRYLN